MNKKKVILIGDGGHTKVLYKKGLIMFSLLSEILNEQVYFYVLQFT